MELLDILRSVRRYWALTAGVILVFLLLGLLASFGRGEQYEASALVVVSFADTEGFGAPSTDRYVQNQLVVFQSSMLATRVAEELDGLSSEQVQSMIDFEQVDGSDIIRVIARSGSADRAQEVPNAYAAEYVELVREQIFDSSSPQIEAIDSELEAIAEDLQQLTTEIGAADPGVQTPNQERAELRARQTELNQLREELVLARNQAQAGNRILQEAELPAPSGNAVVILAAALFVGTIAGAVAAAAYGRITGRVLDGAEVGETLGVPLAASLPSLPRRSRAGDVFENPLDGVAIRGLCVRVEGQTSGDSLVVAVAGSDAASGATTTAVAISANFARQGLDPLLVDLDVMDPELSRLVDRTDDGIAALLDGSGSPTSTDVPLPGVRFTGVGTSPARVPPQRVEELVDALRLDAKVVVIDCGSVLDSATALRLVEQADAAILVVPIKRQRSDGLSVVAEELRAVTTAVLPVTAPVARR